MRYDSTMLILRPPLTDSDQPQAHDVESDDEANEHQIDHHHIPILFSLNKVYWKTRQWGGKKAGEEVKKVSSGAHSWPLLVVLLPRFLLLAPPHRVSFGLRTRARMVRVSAPRLFWPAWQEGLERVFR